MNENPDSPVLHQNINNTIFVIYINVYAYIHKICLRLYVLWIISLPKSCLQNWQFIWVRANKFS